MTSEYNRLAGRKVQRTEALSDGVFAIAITLLVLDIHIKPGIPVHSEAELYSVFCKVLPKMLSYFLS